MVLIVFAVSVLGFLTAQKSRNAVFDEVNEKSQRLTESIYTTLSVRNELLTEKSYGDLNFANTLFNNLVDLQVDYSESVQVGDFNLPILYAGSQRLSLDNTVVDKLKQSTGTAASVLLLHDDKLIRISTTLMQNDNRLAGTYVSSDSPAYKKIINNEEYIGHILIEGTAYITRMKPLLDKDKKVIGAIGIGNKILSRHLEDTLSNIKLGKTGYAYIMDSYGEVILHPFEKGKNVKQLDFVQKMHEGKNGVIEYTYDGVKKLAYYMYFEPWKWYIVTTANYDDLKSSSISILKTTLVVGLLVVIAGGIAALFLANTLVKPVNKLKCCMETAGKGDLSVRCDINSKDEIGILANSFNNMIAENKRLLEETVQYDKLKTEFIANMSHELRTPLNIIFSTAQLFNVLISKGEDLNTDKIRNYTNSIKQNCYRLLRLVNNLIDMTKIDSGFMKLSLKNQDIVQVAEGITQSTAEYVQNMSRNIIFDTDVEEKVMAFDAENLERILLNLISNATKFTEQGDTIEVSLYDKEDQVIISVKDNGRGIPEEKLSQLFQRFNQVDPLLSRSHEGSGIGLSIVKALVEMHKGTIEVKSKVGEGTEFIMCLPSKVMSDKDNVDNIIDIANQSKVEKINIEFSDIYS
jgi:signal transduction histidine kinase